MARSSKYFGFSTKISGRSWLTPATAGVGILGLVALLLFMFLPNQGVEQANSDGAAHATHALTPDVHNHDAHPNASTSVDESEDNRFQVHTHHAELLGEEAYKEAPADTVLWGDLARALVVRRGSTYETTFLPSVLALDGKTISLIGYVTPVTGTDTPSKQFLLSDHAFLCDECAPPTPTELVEVNTKNPVMVKDGVATIRGQFEVVKNDPKGLVYRLNRAIILKQ